MLAKRHQHRQRDAIDGISKPAIKRLSHRGGIKRLAEPVYAGVRAVLKIFLQNVLRDAVSYTDHARRKTITVEDMKHALERQGQPMYGFGAK
jgi:histone H4